MGNAPSHCPCCSSALAPPGGGRDERERGACGYCLTFYSDLNARAKLLGAYRATDFSPLHMGGAGGEDVSSAFVWPAERVAAQTGGLLVLGRAQSTPPGDKGEGLGGFWHAQPLAGASSPAAGLGDADTLRLGLAILRAPPMANMMRAHLCLAVPAGIELLRGTAAPQTGAGGARMPGGARQFWLPPSVASALWPASQRLLAGQLSRAAYTRFLEEARPAFAAHDEWRATYERRAATVYTAARLHNLVRAAQQALDAALAEPGAPRRLVGARAAIEAARTALDAAAKEAKTASPVEETIVAVEETREKATRLLERARAATLDAECDVALEVEPEYTPAEWVATRCFTDLALGNALGRVPPALAALLRRPLGAGATKTDARLGPAIEGRPFIVHREGPWALEVVVTFVRQVSTTSGNTTTTTTYYYNLTRTWLRG